jgi:type II secretory pathway pseudopilin PulG
MNPRGMTLVDVIVGTGIMVVVFLSIFGAYKVAIDLVYNTKARIGGMSLVSKQLEYLRSLPYDSLGTVGGIPSGTILQTATTSLNNIPYTLRTLILYIDDPSDGTGNSDSNLLTADYKELKVESSWVVRGKTYKTFAVTRVAPHGIESLTNGGTLRVNVFDALAQPVQGASVHITNASTTPAVDVTVSTDAGGSVAFPGAPQASNYKVSVSKDLYSSAQTYDITAQNPNPNPAHISVANKQTTTISFAIDKLGSLDIHTYSPIDVGTFNDLLTTIANIAATTSVSVSGGNVHLYDDGTGYALSGDVRSADIHPSLLTSWDLLSWNKTTPTNTNLRVQVVYPQGGGYSLVPDGVVTGNSAGLTSGSVVLSAVSTSTYPTLALKALLDTADASSTPELLDWKVDYHAGPSPLPNIGVSVYGTKTIGTSISGAPIYKVVQSITTSPAGSWLITPLEWDTYTLQLTGNSYDISELCPSPASLAPGESKVESLMLVPRTTHSLRVQVTTAGVPAKGATVTLSAPGNTTLTSSDCGQAFFSGLSASNYTLSVSKSGFQTNAQSISVSGATVITVPLSP